MAREAYDRVIDLGLSDVAVDYCITKAPHGGEIAGRGPVDRGKQGMKRSMIVDGEGIPLGVVLREPIATARRFWPLPWIRWEGRPSRRP